jgi:hypothetical protein
MYHIAFFQFSSFAQPQSKCLLLSFSGLVDFDGRKNGLSADGAVSNCRGAVGADDKVPEIM